MRRLEKQYKIYVYKQVIIDFRKIYSIVFNYNIDVKDAIHLHTVKKNKGYFVTSEDEEHRGIFKKQYPRVLNRKEAESLLKS